jgi:hypothetical protein
MDKAIVSNDIDEANDVIVAVEADAVDKANMINKAKAMADVAANKAHVADEANKANELDELDEANEANATNKAVVSNVVNEANKANEADKAIATNEANNADEAYKADDADKVIAANATNKAIKTNEFRAADKADVNNQANAKKVGVSVELPLLFPFSLTKYSAIFMEVKGCFGINHNQLGSLKGGCLSLCSLMIRFVNMASKINDNQFRHGCSLSKCHYGHNNHLRTFAV